VVAPADTEASQGVGQAVHAGVELGVGKPPGPVDDRQVPRERPSGLRQERADIHGRAAEVARQAMTQPPSTLRTWPVM
jgi:hypothetical protein